MIMTLPDLTLSLKAGVVNIEQSYVASCRLLAALIPEP